MTVFDDDVHFAGTLHIEAELDIADALDVDRALVHGAATRKALGSASRWTPDAPPRSVTSPAPRPPSTSTPTALAAHDPTACPSPAWSSCTPTSTPRSTT